MMECSLVRVADVLKVAYAGVNPLLTGVSIDSRTINPLELFFAIEGEQFDGHDFVKEAKAKGAQAAVVSRHVDVDIPQLIVKDTTEALGLLAADCRDKIRIPLIAVTGSVGKTTTKNLITSILQAAFGKDKVLSTPGGHNNHWGLPLALMRLLPTHRVAVVEMGMNHFSELTYLSRIAKPDVAVITNVAPCHLQGVGDIQGVARAKAEIFSGLSLQGSAILCKDQTFFDFWQQQLKGQRVISFGCSLESDVWAVIKTIMPVTAFTLHTPMGDTEISLQLIGAHNVKNALAAAAAALVLDIDLSVIKEGLEAVVAIPGRLRMVTLGNGATLFDDAYNANPLSVSAAIDTLQLAVGKKILVLGDMKELGVEAARFHQEIGHYAKTHGIDYLLTVGELTRDTCTAFGEHAMHFATNSALQQALMPLLKPGVSVLIKGSLSMRMQDIVAHLMHETMLA